MIEEPEIAFGDAIEGFALRDYQFKARGDIKEARKRHSRILVVSATGTGKTTLFADAAAIEVSAGGRVLILAHRDRLVRQGAKRVSKETGIFVDIEMASERASLESDIVFASIPTLHSDARLLGFPEGHFSLVICDETHHALSKSWMKVLNYFHFGEVSLADGWVAPSPDVPYTKLCDVLGVTATPDLATKRDLGEFYQVKAFEYQYVNAVEDGWLVPPVTKNIPLRIDLRELRPSRTPNGSDYTDGALSRCLIPVIEALAEQIVALASDRKTMAFVPSIDCARRLADAITRRGLNGIFVSGECDDVDEKTERFIAAGPGTVACNAALYTEGFDCPDVSCVAMCRATKSKGFYRQMAGRGTRVLPGLVEHLSTAEERRSAIAASAKPNLLIIDPLWLVDKHDLSSAYDLMTNRPEVAAAMSKADNGKQSLLELAERAERDFLDALAKEAARHSNKKARTIDPLAWAVSLGDASLAGYEPMSKWDELPAHPKQVEFLAANGIASDKPICRGLAEKIIDRINNRAKLGLASPKQLAFLVQLGMKEEDAALLSKGKAGVVMQALIRKRNAARAAR